MKKIVLMLTFLAAMSFVKCDVWAGGDDPNEGPHPDICPIAIVLVNSCSGKNRDPALCGGDNNLSTLYLLQLATCGPGM